MKRRTTRGDRMPALLARLRGPVVNACSLLLLVACWIVCASITTSLAATPVNLDLTSTQASITPTSLKGTVQIRVGNTTQRVNSGSLLTPAEYLAAIQVSSGGKQSIILGGSGNAVGGTFAVNTIKSPISGLVVPQGVTGINNFATASKLSVTGDFVNSGTFYALSTSTRVRTATIDAADIINNQGALLTTVLPAGGLLGYRNAINNLSLTLSAINSIINHGTISSANALSLTAANITNAPLTGAPASSALLQSAGLMTLSANTINNSRQLTAILNNININANNLTNSGLIQAAQGALTMRNLTANTLNIIGTGGSFSALNGITATMLASSSSNQMNMTGGSFSGSSLTLDSKLGNITSTILDVPANLSVKAAGYNVAVTNGSSGLAFTNLNPSSKATLSYTGAGDVTLRTMNTNGGSLNIDTTGDILVVGANNSKPGDINTTPKSGSGGNIVLSGKTISTGNLTASSSAAAGNGGIISLTAASSADNSITTGSITDTGSAGGGVVSFRTPGTLLVKGNITTPGGTLTLATSAYTVTGKINLGSSGAVDLQYNGTDPYVVNFSDLTKFGTDTVSVGSTGGFANDIILNADCINCLGSVTNLSFDTAGKFVATGHALQLSADTDFSVVAASGINTGTVSGGKSVSFATQGDLVVDGALTTPGAIVLNGDTLSAGHALTIDAGKPLKGSSITLTTGAGDITNNSSLTATGGNLAIAAGGNLNINSGSNLSATGGDLVLSAGQDVHLTSGVNVKSVAVISGGGSNNTKYDSLPNFSGGQIAVFAGKPSSSLSSILSALTSQRLGSQETVIVEGGTLDSSNKITSTGGSILKISFPQGGIKSITNSTFDLQGAVMYIDPPGTNNVIIDGASFVAVGPQLSATGTGAGGGNSGGNNGGNSGGNNGGGNSGGTGNVGGSTGGSIAPGTGGLSFESLSFSNAALSNSSSITSRDLLGENSIFNNVSGGSSIAPSDSTRTDNGKHDGLSAAVYCSKPGVLKENDEIDKDSWIIASNKCQPFSFETADGAIIIGTGPAIFAPAAHHTLLLKEGKLLVIAGDTMVVVRTPQSSVTVPVNSAATVEYNPGGLSRLTSLAGGKASVSVTREGETMIISVAAGEQLVLADENVPDTEITCQPDVSHKKIDAWGIMLSGLRGQKFTFDRSEMVSREGLLNCTLGCFNKVQQSMIDEIRKSMLLVQPKELKSFAPLLHHHTLISKKDDASHVTPVGWGQVLDLTAPEVHRMYCKTAQVKFTQSASIAIENDSALNIKFGDVLVNTTAPTTITAGRYSIKLAAGTVAMISNRQEHVVVRDLYESKGGSIIVITPEQKTLAAQVGQEIIVGRAGLSYTKVLGEDAVGRRRMRHIDMGRLSNAVISEVSLVSLLQNTDVLSQLMRSDAADDKALINKVEKMAVVLQFATGSHGNYSMVGQ